MNLIIHGILEGIALAVLSYGIAYWAAKGWYAGKPKQDTHIQLHVNKDDLYG